MSSENRDLFDDPFEQPVVGEAEPVSRGISPEEMPYDRRPNLRSPYVWLYCRGPFKFQRTAQPETSLMNGLASRGPPPEPSPRPFAPRLRVRPRARPAEGR